MDNRVAPIPTRDIVSPSSLLNPSHECYRNILDRLTNSKHKDHILPWLFSKDSHPPFRVTEEMLSYCLAGEMYKFADASHAALYLGDSSQHGGMHMKALSEEVAVLSDEAQQSPHKRADSVIANMRAQLPPPDKVANVPHASWDDVCLCTLTDSSLPFSFLESPGDVVPGFRRAVVDCSDGNLWFLSNYWLVNGRSVLMSMYFPYRKLEYYYKSRKSPKGSSPSSLFESNLDFTVQGFPNTVIMLLNPYPDARYPKECDIVETAVGRELESCEFCIARGNDEACQCSRFILNRSRPLFPEANRETGPWHVLTWYINSYLARVKKHEIILNNMGKGISTTINLFAVMDSKDPSFDAFGSYSQAHPLAYIENLKIEQENLSLRSYRWLSANAWPANQPRLPPSRQLALSWPTDSPPPDSKMDSVQRVVQNEQVGTLQLPSSAAEETPCRSDPMKIDLVNADEPGTEKTLPKDLPIIKPISKTKKKASQVVAVSPASVEAVKSEGFLAPKVSAVAGIVPFERPKGSGSKSGSFRGSRGGNLLGTSDTPVSDQPPGSPLPLPFPCDHCTKVFARKHDLKRHHQSVHERVRKYSCEACNKHFLLNQHLKAHLLQVHGAGSNPAFSCPECNTTFTSKVNLRRHRKQIHDIQDSDELEAKSDGGDDLACE